MFKLSHRLYRACRGFKGATLQKRLFLSEAYRCDDAWARRLESPLFQKFECMTMFMELEQKFASMGKVSAVDVDIFVNSVNDDSFVDEIMRILHNLRQCTETTNTLDSTHHAVIRYLWQYGYIQELHEILYDRLNYGIFADHYCYNLLMDDFIKKKDYDSAAKMASLVMLQEDTDHPITNALCIYSCHKYLENPDGWKKPEIPEDTSEEEKVRVRYVRNPYFDDHFDLTDPRDLVGKTLNFQGKHRADALGRTCQLRGLIMYKKYDQVLELMKKWLETIQEEIVYEEVFELISKDNSRVQDQASEQLKLVEDQLSILKKKQNHKESLIEAIEAIIRSAVKEEADNDISKKCQAYIDWEHVRNAVLKEQMKAIDREKRIANINKIKEDLKMREQLLTFFDKEEDIELKIEKIEERERKKDEHVRSIPRSAKKLRELVAAETYIPPDVKSKPQ